MSVVQSILFDSKMWSVRDAVQWLQENGFKATKIDETVNFYRFRQFSPKSLKDKGYTEYRVKKLKNGIDFVLAFKPTIYSEDCI